MYEAANLRTANLDSFWLCEYAGTDLRRFSKAALIVCTWKIEIYKIYRHVELCIVMGMKSGNFATFISFRFPEEWFCWGCSIAFSNIEVYYYAILEGVDGLVDEGNKSQSAKFISFYLFRRHGKSPFNGIIFFRTKAKFKNLLSFSPLRSLRFASPSSYSCSYALSSAADLSCCKRYRLSAVEI